MSGNQSADIVEVLPFEKIRFHARYLKYYAAKRQNFMKCTQDFRDLWDCFQYLDDIWQNEISDIEVIREPTQMLPSLLCRYGHSRYVVAMELGFSCCIGDAYSVIRGGIEAVAQAHRIHREPTLTNVWTDKAKGKAEEERFKQEFEHHKATRLFPAEHGLSELFFYWKQFSSLGPHSGIHSVGKSFEEITAEKKISWAFHYFETDPTRLATYLSALLQASGHMEKAFHSIFEPRLKLDAVLDGMRDRFNQKRQSQIEYLQKTYKL
ncbi:MAG: hypothetical protein LAO19_20980 [Acidobacteriia bacterium]|nr:hypothetical protein [Terriglobia bacterium]